VGPVVIDLTRRSVTIHGHAVDVPRKEFELLRVLAQHAGEVVSRQDLLETVWGEDFFGEEKTLDVHISRLRQRLEEDPDSPRLIQTVRGVGYLLVADA
jgi:two-component system response regulator RegX3